jgi:hypothetical protein
LTVPGEGVFSFIKIVASEVEPVELRTVRSELLVANQAAATSAQSERLEVRTTQLELAAQTPARLFLRRVDASGKEGEDVELPMGLLEEGLLDAVSRLPNGRYRVYYQEPNSQRVRMVREVNVHQGRVVPPDFRENVGERQPGGKSSPATPEGTSPQGPERNGGPPAESNAPAARPSKDAGSADSGADMPSTVTSGTGVHNGAAVAAFSIAAVESRQRWAEQVDGAFRAERRSLAKSARLCRRLRRQGMKS